METARIKCFLSLFLFIVSTSHAVEWTQYRGSNTDGTSTETIRTNWQTDPPVVLWKKSISQGLSSMTISGGRVFTQGARSSGAQGGLNEFCIALDANTGKELWARDVGVADYPNGGVGVDDGPRSTPTVDGSRVYVFASYMKLFCLNVTNGAVHWSKDLISQFGSVVIAWQNAASPLLVGDFVIVNSNGRSGEHLIAFRKSDGSVAWKTRTDGMTQASPVVANLGGIPQAIFFAQSGLVSVAVDSGNLLWQKPLIYNGVSVAASPVVMGDMVYCSRAYSGSLSRPQAGAVVVKISGSSNSFTVSDVWMKVNQLMNHWATPVYYNGHVYGIFGESALTFQCVDATNGVSKWTSPQSFGYGSVLVVKDKILAATDKGELALVDPNPAAYTELGRFNPFTGTLRRSWNNPSVSDGRIYVRTTYEIAALDVAPRLPTPTRLSIENAGGIDLTVSSDDGTAISSERAAKLQIYSSPSLDTPLDQWQKAAETPILINGKLILHDSQSNSTPRRYFRAVEQP